MAYPTVALGTTGSGIGLPDATYRRKAAQTIFDKKMYKEILDRTLFSKWIGGEGSNSVIVRKTDNKKARGDTIRCFGQLGLTGAGVFGNRVLVDAEQLLETNYKEIHLNKLRSGVVTAGEVSEMAHYFPILERSKPALQSWAEQKLDEYFIYTYLYGYPPHVLGTAATYYGLGQNSSVAKPPRYWYCADSANNSITYSATDATYIDAIEAAELSLSDTTTDYMSPDILEFVGTQLEVANIRPASVGGRDAWVGVFHPYQIYQLRKNATWFSAAITAGPRDTDGNPVFAGVRNGFVGLWNNIALYSSNNVHNSAPTESYGETLVDDAADTSVYRAMFLGLNAMFYAEGRAPKTVVEPRDYDDKVGVAYDMIFGMGRNEMWTDVAGTSYHQNGMVVSTYSPAATT